MGIRNYYQRGTEAKLHADCIERTMDNLENEIETALDSIEHMENEVSDLEEERDQLQKDHDALEEEVAALRVDKQEVITLLTTLLRSADAIKQFATNKLIDMGALNASENPDSDSGDSGDGGGEDSHQPDAGSRTTEGVTRPQIP